MRYITSEQFLQADKVVQEALLKWWKPTMGDLVEYRCNGLNKVLALDVESILDLNNGYLCGVIPLFNLQQLMEYIEEEACSGVEIQHFSGYECIGECSCLTSEHEGFFKDEDFEYHGDILQAMWKLAQRIAKGMR